MTAKPKHILVCDDERHLREMVGEYLESRGFRATLAEDSSEMRRALARHAIDLLILDVNMPGEDGLSALRSLRAQSSIPVIMLTAAAEVIDRVVGLEMGADDYVGKPVDMRELEARVKAALRRQSPAPDAQDDPPAQSVQIGDYLLDLGASVLRDADGNEVTVTAMEFDLLRVFAENRGRILNRDQLLEQAHSRDWEPFDRSIDLRISRLRRKIEPNPTKPRIIQTVRGLGYVLK